MIAYSYTRGHHAAELSMHTNYMYTILWDVAIYHMLYAIKCISPFNKISI